MSRRRTGSSLLVRALLPALATVALATVALATVLLASAAPAHAEGEIGLSRDGRSWAESIRGPLLEEDFRWVPGDQAVEHFFVRNQGPSAAELAVEVRTETGARLLADDAVKLTARVDGGEWTELTNGDPSATLTQRSLARDDVARVEVAIEFRWIAPNDTMTERLPLEFVVRLTGDEAGAGPADGPRGDGDNGGAESGGGILPGTGSALAPYWLWIAAASIGSGLALLVGRRREREERADA